MVIHDDCHNHRSIPLQPQYPVKHTIPNSHQYRDDYQYWELVNDSKFWHHQLFLHLHSPKRRYVQVYPSLRHVTMEQDANATHPRYGVQCSMTDSLTIYAHTKVPRLIGSVAKTPRPAMVDERTSYGTRKPDLPCGVLEAIVEHGRGDDRDRFQIFGRGSQLEICWKDFADRDHHHHQCSDYY